MSGDGDKPHQNPEEEIPDYEEDPHHHDEDIEHDEEDGDGGGGEGGPNFHFYSLPKAPDQSQNQYMMAALQHVLRQQYGDQIPKVTVGQYTNFSVGADGVEDVTLKCQGCQRLERLGDNFIRCRGCEVMYCCMTCQKEDRKNHKKDCPDPILDWPDTKARTLELISKCTSLPNELLLTVLAYCAPKLYDPFPAAVVVLPNQAKPSGLTTDGKSLYVCDLYGKRVLQYDTNGQLIYTWDKDPSGRPYFPGGPRRLDIAKGYLYVVDETTVYRINLKTKELIHTWVKPTEYGATGLKVIDDFIYLTIWELHQVFIFSLEGHLLFKLGLSEEGEEGEEPGFFSQPFGLTSDERHVYVSDKGNHRIQVFEKGNGAFNFKSTFGQEGTSDGFFGAPLSLHISPSNDLLYVGDFMSVQVFTKEGIFLERIGGHRPGRGVDEFSEVYGVTVIGNSLFAGDYNSSRIKIFRELE